MRTHIQKILSVDEGSIGQEMGLEPGDVIAAINGHRIEDVFDYQYLIKDEHIDVLVQTKDGQEVLLDIDKDFDEDLGLEFESSLMDDYRSCSNKCIFCFIDQLPDGLRDTLYFKDDDSRLSFLQGNYITMTNMSDQSLQRLIDYRLEPINISVHTTDPQLRIAMLHNRFAGKINDQLNMLRDGGIIMNGQIVLCKGVNDGIQLDKTIRDLTHYIPLMESLSVVPVGLSDHREGLCRLEPFTKEDACQVIDCIEGWQDKIYKEFGTHFVQASDEWYLLAGRSIPQEDRYDGYLQLENGVGMLRLFMDEFRQELSARAGDDRIRHVTVATGTSAGPTLMMLAGELTRKFPHVRVDVREIINNFFGSHITVSGLMTGSDIIRQLRTYDLGTSLLIPVNALRSGEDVLLDDIRVPDIESALQIPVSIVQSNGQDLVKKILDQETV